MVSWEAYQPLVFHGYWVRYDAAGRCDYRHGAARHYIRHGSAFYGRCVRHYRRYRSH